MENLDILNNGQWVLSKTGQPNPMLTNPQEHPLFEHYAKQAAEMPDDMLHHMGHAVTQSLSSHLLLPGSPNHETTGRLRAMQHAFGLEGARRNFPSKPV